MNLSDFDAELFPQYTPLDIQEPFASKKVNIHENLQRESQNARVQDCCLLTPPLPHILNNSHSSVPGTLGRDLTCEANEAGLASTTASTVSSSRKVSNKPSDSSSSHSTVSGWKEYYIAASPAAIMGNFIPLDSSDEVEKSKDERDESPNTLTSSASRSGLYPQYNNPYEFEPDSPYLPQSRQPTFNDFQRQNDNIVPSPRVGHTKSSRSADNTDRQGQKPLSSNITPAKSASQPLGRAPLQKSESSPNLLPTNQFRPLRMQNGTSTSRHNHSHFAEYDVPDNFDYEEYREPIRVRNDDEESHYPQENLRRHEHGNSSRSPKSSARHDNNRRDYAHPSFPYDNLGTDHTRSSSPYDSRKHTRGRTSSRLPREDALPASTLPLRTSPSPSKTLDSLSEEDSYLGAGNLPGHYSPFDNSPVLQKRSRSPMKKLFGETGWFGALPDKNSEQDHLQNRPAHARNDLSSGQKKTTILGKIKNKLGEIAEKADLAPSPNRERGVREKQAKLSLLSVSLGPPEQAKIHMEAELMLVHTGNAFLMNQFSQGRISVDSIKKTVDNWKSKGRPLVIEFMYDQATQRDLIATNQQNFRFHGPRAGDDIRISSMLYNWKQVASVMAIRTFCNADTIVLKLLFDIEQILELLGAGEPIMLRLQQLRMSSNEMIRVVRQGKEAASAYQTLLRNRDMTWESSMSQHTIRSSDRLYSSMKQNPSSRLD